jgi:hypothetical protein
MKKSILEDKHFIKYKQMWLFMKSFYEKFKTFDIELMANVATNKYKMMDYVILLIEREPAPSLFDIYQKTLIELYNQRKEEKEMIEKIYKLSNDLYFKKISPQDFKKEVNQIVY